MITQAEFRSLSTVRETTDDTAEECTLFCAPTGEARIVVRPLRRTNGRWRLDPQATGHVFDGVTATDVAAHFGVTDDEARHLLDVARRDGQREQAEGGVLLKRRREHRHWGP